MNELITHPQWPAVLEVATRLHERGYQAFLAGGCVRDALLGVSPQDFDIATDARPETVETLFARAITVGKQFGVIKIPFDEFQIEVATFRRDSDYQDGRRPTDVVYSTAEEDAERRDFTVNALFFDLKTSQVLDYVDGLKDLKAQLIRAVGVPRLRFEEDKLRLLRAVRFQAQLGFSIEDETLQAVAEFASHIRVVSAERIREEMTKLLKQPRRALALKTLEKVTLLKELFPDVAATVSFAPTALPSSPSLFRADMPIWEQTRAALADVADVVSPDVWWTLFFSGVAKRIWIETKGDSSFRVAQVQSYFESSLAWLKFSKRDLKSVTSALAYLPSISIQSEWVLHDFKRLFAQDWADILLDAYAADSRIVLGSGRSSEWYREHVRSCLGFDRSLPTPYLSGADLQKAGLVPGPRFRELLDTAFDLQLDGALQSREEALIWLKEAIL